MENLMEQFEVMHSGDNLITKLNYDCLTSVLQYISLLDRLEMEKVSQEWKEKLSELFWHDIKKLDFNDLMITIDKREEIFKKIIIKCCRYLTNLKITDDHYPWMRNILNNNCRNIVHFSIDMNIIRGYKIFNEDLVQIITSMTKLKYLEVSVNLEDGCRSNLLNQILDKLPNSMEEIHWNVPDDKVNVFNTISPVLDKFHGLRCLTLQKLCLTDVTMDSIVQNANTLVALDLSQCRFSPGMSSMAYLENLEKLILWSITNFNLDEITFIAHHCSKLKYFEFFSRNNDGSQVLVPFPTFRQLSFLNLEHLKFHTVDNNVRYENDIIANIWQNLKYLNIAGNYFCFSISGVLKMTELKNLEFLDLNEITVDSESFITIASNCLKLKALVMNFKNWVVEDIPEIDLEKLTNLKKLERLDLSCCTNLTGNLLSKIVSNCKKLVDLKLVACHNVTEASLMEVGKLHLKKLSIDGIENVPNAMFDNFQNLEFLSCKGCLSVTDEGIMKVIDKCHKLSTLNVYNSGISIRTLHHALKRKFVFKPLILATSLFMRYEHPDKIFPSTTYLKIVSRLVNTIPLHHHSNVKARSYLL